MNNRERVRDLGQVMVSAIQQHGPGIVKDLNENNKQYLLNNKSFYQNQELITIFAAQLNQIEKPAITAENVERILEIINSIFAPVKQTPFWKDFIVQNFLSQHEQDRMALKFCAPFLVKDRFSSGVKLFNLVMEALGKGEKDFNDTQGIVDYVSEDCFVRVVADFIKNPEDDRKTSLSPLLDTLGKNKLLSNSFSKEEIKKLTKKYVKNQAAQNVMDKIQNDKNYHRSYNLKFDYEMNKSLDKEGKESYLHRMLKTLGFSAKEINSLISEAFDEAHKEQYEKEEAMNKQLKKTLKLSFGKNENNIEDKNEDRRSKSGETKGNITKRVSTSDLKKIFTSRTKDRENYSQSKNNSTNNIKERTISNVAKFGIRLLDHSPGLNENTENRIKDKKDKKDKRSKKEKIKKFKEQSKKKFF